MKKRKLTDKWRKIITIGLIIFILCLSIFLYFFWGQPLIKFLMDAEKVHAYVESHPFSSRIFFMAAVFLQVVVAVIPGGPFEIGAGYAFGAVEGALVSLAGISAAGILIFLFVKKFGKAAIEIFFPPEKIESVKIFKNKKRLHLIVFIVFLIPGTPKDLLTYMAGLTPIRLSEWLILSTLARFPAILASTIAGTSLAQKNTGLALAVFFIGSIAAFAGVLIFNKLNSRKKS